MTTTATDQATRSVLDIRKYSNRRFYDATRSMTVTLEDIHRLGRDGAAVRITAAQSGDDITAAVLVHIIIDMDTLKLAVFPVELLHRLIRSNEALVRDFVDKYFNQALAAFLQSREKFDEHLRQFAGLPFAGAAPAESMRLMWSPLASALAPAGGAGEPPPGAARNGDESALRRSVDDLQRQVAALQEQVGKLANQGPTVQGARPATDKGEGP